MFSSMSMSLNSLESKTSPHSWHSTNSTSSSRATTRTRGCLQIFFVAVVSEDFFAIGDVWIGFIFGSRHGSPAPLSNSGYFYAGMAACQDIFRTGAGFWPPYRRQWMRIPRPGLLPLSRGPYAWRLSHSAAILRGCDFLHFRSPDH